MAGRIQGITIKLKGDTSDLQNSLNQVYKSGEELNRELRQINTSLKFHPGNTDLIAQKQRVLGEAVENTRKKLDDLKKAQQEAQRAIANGDPGAQAQYDKLTREILKTEDQLKSMSRELKQSESAMRQWGESMQRSGEKVKAAGDKIKGVGEGLTQKVTLPLAAVGVAGFKMAADLQDAMGATDQIFKSQAGEMKRWADSLETYYGIAEGEALQYANTMGAMLQNIGGLTEEEAAKQSQILVELAGDLSAMFGGTTESAIQALTGALKGNNSMLDNYGMGVNEATIKTKAMEMGLIAEGEQLDLAGKQAATLALIMEQTGDAQGQAAREAEGASGTLKSFATDVKNLASDIGEVLIPIFTPMIQKIREGVKAFKDMSPEAKELVVKIGLIAAAIGPVLVVLGSMIGAVGSAMSGIGLLGVAFGGGGAAATAFGATIAGLAGPVGIAVAAIAGIAGAAIALSQDALPEVDHFASGVSDATAEAVGAFLELEEQATTSLQQMVWSGQEVTAEYAETIGGAFTQMKDTILTSLTEQRDESATTLQEMFDNNASISSAEREKILAALDEEYNSKSVQIEEGEARVQEILSNASEQKRELTETEKEQINLIQEEMRNTAVQTLSESEAEQLAIMESLRANAGVISAQQAAEVVQNSVKQKDEAIAAANTEYEERLKAAAQLRASGSEEAAAMADKIVEEATRQRDEAVNMAESMHTDVVEEAKAQAGEHVAEVDWSTGEIKSKWEVMAEKIDTTVNDFGDKVATRFGEIARDGIDRAEELRKGAVQAFDDLRRGASEKMEAAREAISTKINDAKRAVEDKTADIVTAGRTNFEAFRESASTKFGEVKTAVSSGLRNAYNTVTGWFGSFATAGGNIVGNIASGVRNAVWKVRDAINGVVSKIRDYLPFSPAKEGPLRDLDKLNFGGTIARSITKGTKDVTKAMGGLVGDAMDTLEDGMIRRKPPIADTMGVLDDMGDYTQAFFDTGQNWMRALAAGIQSGMQDVRTSINSMPQAQVQAAGTGVQWYDSSGIFRSPTVIAAGEKRPVSSLDDLKSIVAEVIDKRGSGGDGDIVITGNTFAVREEADIRKIAEELMTLADRKKRGGR